MGPRDALPRTGESDATLGVLVVRRGARAFHEFTYMH
jgi:hypothetical protein